MRARQEMFGDDEEVDEEARSWVRRERPTPAVEPKRAMVCLGDCEVV